MKHKKIIERPASIEIVTDFITCDLCREKIESKRYTIDEVVIELIGH